MGGFGDTCRYLCTWEVVDVDSRYVGMWLGSEVVVGWVKRK